MKKSVAASNPDEYLSNLSGWQKALVYDLRAAVLRAGHKLEETIKWGHLVYSFNGPVLLIRAETERVLFGFWRGQCFLDIEPALKPGGKYEMATLTIYEGDNVDFSKAEQLTKEAVALNQRPGDPRDDAKNPDEQNG